MKKKLILFDFDGTVADNSEGIINCIKYSLGKMGFALPDADTLRKFIGPSLFYSFTEYIERDEKKAEVFVAGYRERYEPVGTTEVRLYPGMEKVLRELKNSGCVLAVCSGKPLPFVKKICGLLGITDCFDGLFCTDFQSHTNDKSDFILDAVKRFGVEKSETLMIGDTLYDVRAAKTAGVECLGVEYGFGAPGELENEGADYLTDTVEGIYSAITGKTL